MSYVTAFEVVEFSCAEFETFFGEELFKDIEAGYFDLDQSLFNNIKEIAPAVLLKHQMLHFRQRDFLFVGKLNNKVD